ncbi:MAG: adenylyltransferase/cytidyltransferase family protein, partial [Gemmatimonadales bacterium]
GDGDHVRGATGTPGALRFLPAGRRTMNDSSGKIRDLSGAVAWRAAQSGPVAFTNGVFDLLHPGHVELLEAARREGEALMVGLNSDASVRRLGKGAGRPVVAEAARARVLAALAAVDCVVLFDEDTPLQLLQALAPDVLVKGADYARDRIVGADWIESRGGRVVRVPLVAGFSSSALVERLRAPS